MPVQSRSLLLIATLLLLPWLGHSNLARAGSDGRSTTEILTEQLEAFLAGASVNDRATHEAFWAEELVYTSSSGERFGRAEILTGIDATAGDNAEAPIYSASEIHVQDFGETAVVTFRLHAAQGNETIAEYFNTGVFRYGELGWRAVTWQATRVAASAEPDQGTSE
jgi:hypothetical protein